MQYILCPKKKKKFDTTQVMFVQRPSELTAVLAVYFNYPCVKAYEEKASERISVVNFFTWVTQ